MSVERWTFRAVSERHGLPVGGAAGVIAVGGGAAGYYALGGGGRGKHVLSYQRRDPQAVQFFCTYLPRLREAFEVEDTAPPPPVDAAAPRP